MNLVNSKNCIILMSTMAAVSMSLTACGDAVTAEDLRHQYVQEETVRRTTDQIYDNAYGTYSTMRDSAGEFSREVGEKAGDAAGYAADKAQDAGVAAGEFYNDTRQKAEYAAEDARQAAGDFADGAKQAASETAEGVKQAASDQANDSKEDTRYIFNSISDEWHHILDTLQSPWGLGEAFGGPASSLSGTVTAQAASSGSVLTDGQVSDKAPIIKRPDFDFSTLGSYAGTTCITVNGNKPFFDDSELTVRAFEEYSPLDSLGRCGMAYANICPEIMPSEDRGEIGMIKPSGWNQNKYPGIIKEDPPYLYNRCHLIAFSLAGENANPKNLITGTRHFNIETGMEAYELQVLSYVKRTGNHVLYRVTPYFKDDELVARGVLMEAKSVEDNGTSFCVFIYNVQPGIEIDYKTGKNWAL